MVIDFRIYYPRNFIFRFPINYDWSGGQLYSLGEGVGCYDSKLKGLSDELTLVLSNTRELDRVPSTE